MYETAVAANYLAFAARRMRLSAQNIEACCGRLSEEQMWHRGGDYENSVANLLLHLAGNLRQWVMHGIAGNPDVRERDAEFSLESTATAAEAHERFTSTIAEASGIIAALPSERLLEVIDPQPGGTWRNVTILEAIFQVTAHVQEHKGQIVLLTKQLMRDDLDLSMPRKR